MSNEINLLKIAYRNVWVCLSFPSLANALRTNKAFQQTFLTQLTIYNFLFDRVQENNDESSLVLPNNGAETTSAPTNDSLDEFCQKTNFSLTTNNALDFLERFNGLTNRKCVMKELVVRSVDLNDIQDDLNYFSVFVQNALHLKVSEIQPHNLIEVTASTASISQEEDELPTEHPSFSEFANMGRSNWIEQQMMVRFLNEVMENKIYIYDNKPKGIIVLKWFAMFALGLTMLVNTFLCGFLLYSLFGKVTTTRMQNFEVLGIFFVFILIFSSYIFYKELRNILMSLKGNGISMPLLWSPMMMKSRMSDGGNKQKKIQNNDNVRFYFNWRGILLFVVLTIICLASIVLDFFKDFKENDGLHPSLTTIELTAAIAFVVAYGLLILSILAAIIINPKQNFALITRRQNEIREELVTQTSDDEIPPMTPPMD